MHFWASDNPYTPVMSLKCSMCTNGSIHPKYLKSGKQKSLEMTTLMISGEKGDSTSSIIRQLGALLYPCMSSIICASLRTSSSSCMVRLGSRVATWSCCWSALCRCCESSLSSIFTALSLLSELCLPLNLICKNV